MLQQQQNAVKMQQSMNAGMNMAAGGQQGQVQQGMPPNMAGAPVPPMGQQIPDATLMAAAQQISPADILKVRNHPSGKFAQASDDQIRQFLINNKLQTRQQQLQMQQAMQQQMQAQANGQMGGQMQMNRAVSGAVPQVQQPPKQPPIQRPQPGQVQQRSASQQGPQAATPVQRAAKAAQPSSSPAQPQKNNAKRPNEEPQGHPAPDQQQTGQQQPQPQQQRPPHITAPPQLTNEQIAKLTPEQRERYMKAVKAYQMWRSQQQLGISQEDQQLFANIRTDEMAKFPVLPPIPMTKEARDKVADKLQNMAPKLMQTIKVVPKWFAMTHDENRLRQFFRAVSYPSNIIYISSLLTWLI
jgi:hypothetical protein